MKRILELFFLGIILIGLSIACGSKSGSNGSGPIHIPQPCVTDCVTPSGDASDTWVSKSASLRSGDFKYVLQGAYLNSGDLPIGGYVGPLFTNRCINNGDYMIFFDNGGFDRQYVTVYGTKNCAEYHHNPYVALHYDKNQGKFKVEILATTTGSTLSPSILYQSEWLSYKSYNYGNGIKINLPILSPSMPGLGYGIQQLPSKHTDKHADIVSALAGIEYTEFDIEIRFGTPGSEATVLSATLVKQN